MLAEVVDILLSRCATTPDGCMEWSGPVDTSGYPRLRIGGKGKRFNLTPHRIVTEFTYGLRPGEQAHHRCANRLCLAPTHLQPVSQADNKAEMLQRGYYVRRIELLEQALRGLDPDHPLL